MSFLIKCILIFTLTITSVFSNSFNDKYKNILNIILDETEKIETKQTEYEYSSLYDYEKIKVPLKLKKYFNDENCSKVLNKYYYVNCYNYDYKASTAVYYKINKEIMNSGNILQRPSTFSTDVELPKNERVFHKDYTKNIYDMDRGHIISNDTMNHNEKAQLSTFIMSNVVPMLDVVNRGKNSWLGLEILERKMTNKYGELEVLNLIYYSENPNYINNKIAIPESFGKILFNEDKNYKQCFLVKNSKPTNKTIEELEVDCKKLNWN